jgi:hypothetical protein
MSPYFHATLHLVTLKIWIVAEVGLLVPHRGTKFVVAVVNTWETCAQGDGAP